MPTIVLDQQQRNGSVSTASIPVPSADPATGLPYKFVRAAGTMSDADASNTANACQITIRISWDGLSYVTDPAWTLAWNGGVNPKTGGPALPSKGIGIPVDAGGNQPKRVMATLDTVGNLLNTGITIGFESV